MNNYILALLRIYFVVIFLITLSIATLPFWQHFSFLIIPKYILLFLPRWWLLPALLLILFFWCSLVKYQRFLMPIMLLVSLEYLDFQVPNLSTPWSEGESKIKIITVNMGEGSKIYNLNLLIKYYQPEIIVMQEVTAKDIKDSFDDYLAVDCVSGLCVASQIPFERINSLDRKLLGGWGDIAAMYKFNLAGKEINLANIHLETPRSVLLDIIKMGEISGHSKNKDENRLIEAGLVGALMRPLNNVIIAGDFNMADDDILYLDNFSWLNNAFNERGLGLNHTQYINWRGIPFLSFRIDHILYSHNISASEVKVLESLGGDHRPIMATLRIVN